MKKYYNLKLLVFAVLVLFTSCAPTIVYLGESFTPSSNVEVFYDENDVMKDYKVIGQMTNDKLINYTVESVKTEMIRKAQEVGADAVIFTDINVQNDFEGSEKLEVKAKLIKYKITQ